MPEIGKFKRSWLLLSTALTVLSEHRKLLVFPLVTAAFIVVAVLFFTAPVILVPTGHSIFSADHWLAVEQRIFEDSPSRPIREVVSAVRRGDDEVDTDIRPAFPRAWITTYLTVAYLALMFLATFSNVAFANEILNALSGRAVSVRSGLLFAWSRVGSILVWSLFAGLIGIVIRSLEERFGWIGRMILRLIGVVWSVASVFVIPVIVREPGLNPATLLRKSAGTLRKTWGESLIGYLGIQLLGVFMLVSLLVVTISAAAFLAFGLPWIAAALAILWVVSITVLAYLSSVADQIYRCALYVYASEGVTPGPFSADMMDMAWKVK
jgi:Family of unknown function (DUF6159)